MATSDRLSSSENTSNAGNQEDRSIICWCCEDIPGENMVHCANGHLFCSHCLRRLVEEILFGNLKAHSCLPCMDTDDCNESIPLSEIRRALPNDVFERYEERLARQSIIDANIKNLVYCPFCNIPYEVDESLKVLDCPNPKCLRASCIQCKEPNHLPLSCEEAEKLSETAVRRKVEERMTRAVIRQCNTCKAELVKMDDGCNKLTCTMCGTAMCYVCRQTISSGYHHFCNHCSREPGKPCPICDKKCGLWETEEEDNVALYAKEEAMKELVGEEPNLLDQEIGPPLGAMKAQPPSRLILRLGEIEIVNIEVPQNYIFEGNYDFEEFKSFYPKLAEVLVAEQLLITGIELLERLNEVANRDLQVNEVDGRSGGQRANMNLQTKENDGTLQEHRAEDKETTKDDDLQNE